MARSTSQKPLEYILKAALIFAGIVNILPVAGVISADRLEMAYGIAINSPELEILLRHRAVLFGLLGGFLLYAAFRPALRLLACFAGLVSMIAFAAIAYSVGQFGDKLEIVVLADLLGILALVVGLGLTLRFSLSKK